MCTKASWPTSCWPGASIGADPTRVDLFRWHGSEEVEHRNVAHDVAVYVHNSYGCRIRSMIMAVTLVAVFFERGTWYLLKTDPEVQIGWWKMQWLMNSDARKSLLPSFAKLLGSATFRYFRPSFSPEEIGHRPQHRTHRGGPPGGRARPRRGSPDPGLSRRRATAVLAPGCSPRHSPAQRTGPAILAVRRPRAPGRLPHRRPPDSGRRRRIRRGARHVAGGNHGHDERTA